MNISPPTLNLPSDHLSPQCLQKASPRLGEFLRLFSSLMTGDPLLDRYPSLVACFIHRVRSCFELGLFACSMLHDDKQSCLVHHAFKTKLVIQISTLNTAYSRTQITLLNGVIVRKINSLTFFFFFIFRHTSLQSNSFSRIKWP